jgi:hypothetical protein
MEEIRILVGFVRNMRSVQRQGFAFQIGTSPEWIYYTGGTKFAPPFNENEYLAVAVRRSVFAGGQFAALAYRDAGLGAPPRVASLVVPIAISIFGLVLMYVLLANPKAGMPPVVLLFFCTMMVVSALMVVGGMRRVLAGRDAKRLLEQWQPSVEDLQAQRNVDNNEQLPNVEAGAEL